MAGPENPPILLPKRGLPVFKSIFIPKSVLIKDNPSAPPCSAATAISTMLVTLGLNLI